MASGASCLCDSEAIGFTQRGNQNASRFAVRCRQGVRLQPGVPFNVSARRTGRLNRFEKPIAVATVVGRGISIKPKRFGESETGHVLPQLHGKNLVFDPFDACRKQPSPSKLSLGARNELKVVRPWGQNVNACAEAPAAAKGQGLCLSRRDERVGGPREFRTQAIGAKHRPTRPAILTPDCPQHCFACLKPVLMHEPRQGRSAGVVGSIVHQHAAHNPTKPWVALSGPHAWNLVRPSAEVNGVNQVPGFARQQAFEFAHFGRYENLVSASRQGSCGLLDLNAVSSGLRPEAFAGKKKELHRLNVLRCWRTLEGINKRSTAMAIPKFLVGDNTDHPESVFLIHTEFPRFVMDLDTDEIEWLDDVDGEDEADLTDEMAKLLGEAQVFYQREVERYEELED